MASLYFPLFEEFLFLHLKIIHKPLPVDDPQKRCPDIRRAQKELGWTPNTSLSEGLKPTVEWFRNCLFEK